MQVLSALPCGLAVHFSFPADGGGLLSNCESSVEQEYSRIERNEPLSESDW